MYELLGYLMGDYADLNRFCDWLGDFGGYFGVHFGVHCEQFVVKFGFGNEESFVGVYFR